MANSKRKQKELKMKSEMSEKSFNQYLVKKYTDIKDTWDIFFKYTLIMISISLVVSFVMMIIGGKGIPMISFFILLGLFVSLIIWMLIWKFVLKKKYVSYIEESKKIIADIEAKENEKLKKIAEVLVTQKKSD